MTYTDQELAALHKVHFDMRPVMGASIDDLDMEYIKAVYLPAAVAQDILEQNQRPLVQQLHSLRFLVDGAPTWGALIAFGRDPQFWRPGAYVQFLRIAGTSLTDPMKSHKELTGRLEDVLGRLRDLLDINISESIEITSAARESRQPDYPCRVATLTSEHWLDASPNACLSPSSLLTQSTW